MSRSCVHAHGNLSQSTASQTTDPCIHRTIMHSFTHSMHSLTHSSTALHCTALHCTPLHSTPLHSTPPHSTPLDSMALHYILHSTPLHSTPLHSTPWHSTLLHPLTHSNHSLTHSLHHALIHCHRLMTCKYTHVHISFRHEHNFNPKCCIYMPKLPSVPTCVGSQYTYIGMLACPLYLSIYLSIYLYTYMYIYIYIHKFVNPLYISCILTNTDMLTRPMCIDTWV